MRPSGFLLAALSLLSAGCFSMPERVYENVDRESPAFQEAVARETERQQMAGKSRSVAEKKAVRKVTQQTIQEEKQRLFNERAPQIAPLIQALEAFDRPCGCWAYTVATVVNKSQEITADVERFDPFQTEARLWTLVSRNGVTPDEEAQADYRRARLRAWKKELAQTAKRNASNNSRTAQVWGKLLDDLVIEAPDATGRGTFTFTSGNIKVTGMADVPLMRESYATDSATNTVLRHTETFLGTFALLGGSMKIDTWDSATDYVLIAPEMPPFLSKINLHYRTHLFGIDSGDIKLEAVYSDYRSVKCYDERFGVRIGEPSMQNFMPGKN